jgi:hypothetical protein
VLYKFPLAGTMTGVVAANLVPAPLVVALVFVDPTQIVARVKEATG